MNYLINRLPLLRLSAFSLNPSLTRFLRCYSEFESDDAFFKEIPTVYTTAVCFRDQSGQTISRIGTYWGKNDEHNSYKPFTSGVITIARAQIESVSLALKQALYDKKLDGVVVKTDSKYVSNVANRFLQNWRSNNFHKIDGSPVKNRDDIEELDRLLQSIQADIQYVEFVKEGQNILLKYLQEEGIMMEDLNELQSNAFAFDGPKEIVNYNKTNDELDHPVVFVSGSQSKSGNNGFTVAGYGIHWTKCQLTDHTFRFSEMPITLYRAQLMAIIVALEKAIEAKFSRIEIATDCGMFLTHFKAKWLKANGLPIANYPFYKQIVKLMDKIEVKFTYIPESLNNLEMEKSKQLSVDGLAYPVIHKPRTGQFPTELL